MHAVDGRLYAHYQPHPIVERSKPQTELDVVINDYSGAEFLCYFNECETQSHNIVIQPLGETLPLGR